MKKAKTQIAQSAFYKNVLFILISSNFILLLYLFKLYKAIDFIFVNNGTTVGLLFLGLTWASIGLFFTVLKLSIVNKTSDILLNLLWINLIAIVISNYYRFSDIYGLQVSGIMMIGASAVSIITYFLGLLILKFVKINLRDAVCIFVVYTFAVALCCSIYYLKSYSNAKKYVEMKDLKKPGLSFLIDYSCINKTERYQLHKMFTSYILKHYFNWSNVNYKQQFETHEIFGIEKRDNKMFIYGYVFMKSYYSDNRNEDNGCGGNNPIILIAKKDHNTYSIYDHIEPLDGSYNASSISVMFPRKYLHKAFNPTTNQLPSIYEQRNMYLKSIGK